MRVRGSWQKPDGNSPPNGGGWVSDICIPHCAGFREVAGFGLAAGPAGSVDPFACVRSRRERYGQPMKHSHGVAIRRLDSAGPLQAVILVRQNSSRQAKYSQSPPDVVGDLVPEPLSVVPI
jgi:hypothetical protein